jgi:hypothetical protein
MVGVEAPLMTMAFWSAFCVDPLPPAGATLSLIDPPLPEPVPTPPFRLRSPPALLLMPVALDGAEYVPAPGVPSTLICPIDTAPSVPDKMKAF